MEITQETLHTGWTLFAVGTAWFWIVVVAAALFITYLLEQEEYGGTLSTVVCAVTLGLLYFFGAGKDLSSLFQYIEQNPGTVIGVFAGYIAAGVGWSLAKWYFFVLRARDKFLESAKYGRDSIEIPKASTHKARIMSWMFYWPFSALWTSINEPVRRIFVNLFRGLEQTFDNISNKVFMNDAVKKIQDERLAQKAAEDEARKKRDEDWQTEQRKKR